ncbi:GYD domain-containing protein [Chloroflexota bacterium]
MAEAPNHEVIAKLVLAVGSKGNIRSETIRAFKEEEYRKIIAGLP